jgi:hypothetical protein
MLIEFSEKKGFHSTGENVRYRNNTRVLEINDKVATRIWKRVKKFAPSTLCDEKKDIWHAYGLSPYLRFCRYTKGQFFKKHLDERYSLEKGSIKSFYTLMIYLNDVEIDAGGATRFFAEDPFGQNIELLYNITPQKGRALFFWQANTPHDGQPLFTDSSKYILRTEILTYR